MYICIKYSIVTVKLECLTLYVTSALIKYFQPRLEPTCSKGEIKSSLAGSIRLGWK